MPMKAGAPVGVLLTAVLTAVLTVILSGCFNPDESIPFRCSADEPLCPGDSHCNVQSGFCEPTGPDQDSRPLDLPDAAVEGAVDAPVFDAPTPQILEGWTAVTYAGATEKGQQGGTLDQARFSSPHDLVLWGQDVLYASDPDNNCVWKIDTAAQQVSPMLCDPAAFSGPTGIGLFNDGLAVAYTDSHCLKLIPHATAVPQALAGTCGSAGVIAGTSGNAADVLLREPTDVIAVTNFDGSEDKLLIVDSGNHCILELDQTTSMITVFAGICGTAGRADGPRTGQALFENPQTIHRGQEGFFVTEALAATDGGRIRLIVDDEVQLFAGTGLPGSADGELATAAFKGPHGLVDAPGGLLISDTRNHTLRHIDPLADQITTVGGAVNTPGYLDGALGDARFRFPRGLASDGTSIYVADTGNHMIRKLSPP